MNEDEILKRLHEAGVMNVGQFALKLEENAINPSVVRDLRSEGYAALMFASAGFYVEMGDSPDLILSNAGDSLGVEVKHFRLKRQDELDDARLRAAKGFLVEYGDTVPSEGKAAWDQVVDVTESKARQYRPDMPNILVIESSSVHAVDDWVLRTAANILNEQRSAALGMGTANLNGLFLMCSDFNISARRNVYFFELYKGRHSLSSGTRQALQNIHVWSR